MTTRGPRFLHAAFDAPPRARRCLVVLLVLVNGLVAINAYRHPPESGYDAPGHIRYVRTLAQGRLPTRADTYEFHSPPLAYVLPAVAVAAGAVSVNASAKLAQAINLLLSIGLTLYVLRLAQVMRPGNALLKGVAIVLLGSLPVYYKTFTQIRGEPWVAMLSLVLLCGVLRAVTEQRLGVLRAVGLGGGAGLLVLSRQWGVLVLLATALFGVLVVLRSADRRAPLVRFGAIATVAVLAVAGWYGVHVYTVHGTLRAFNRPPPPFSLGNQPASFYVGTGNGSLFRAPVRAAFPNQAIPIFYSETWGDYWCFFLVRGQDAASGAMLNGPLLERALRDAEMRPILTNVGSMAPYLGRVNLVALLPSALLCAGLISGCWSLARMLRRGASDPRVAAGALLALVVLVSGAGYAWFLVGYPNPGKGDTIKASYMVHVFPPLALLAADLLVTWCARARRAGYAVLGLLLLVTLHNVPSLVTRYGSFTREQIDLNVSGSFARSLPARGASR